MKRTIIRKLKQKINTSILKNKSTRIFGSLILLTIIIYVCMWPIMHFTEGSLYIHGNRLEPQYKYFSPSYDGGYFEHFQYILLLWCASLSFLIFLKQNKYTLPIPIIYFFLFLDDSLSLHDSIFSYKLIPFLENTFLTSFTIFSIKNYAEVIYWLIVFLICLLVISPSLKYGDSLSKKFIIDNFKLFILLAFFGSFIDLVAGRTVSLFFPLDPINPASLTTIITRGFLVLTEELGEILTVSLMCIWLFDIVLNKKLLNRVNY